MPVLVDFSVNVSLVIKSHENTKWSGFCLFIFFPLHLFVCLFFSLYIYCFCVFFAIALFFFVSRQFNYFVVFYIHFNSAHLVKIRNLVLLINWIVAVI